MHCIVVVPLQLHPVAVVLLKVRPAGRTSLTVTSPEVLTEPEFFTVMV